MSELHVIVLAAGQGKRMRSALPKVLHPVAGRPMLAHVIDTAELEVQVAGFDAEKSRILAELEKAKAPAPGK